MGFVLYFKVITCILCTLRNALFLQTAFFQIHNLLIIKISPDYIHEISPCVFYYLVVNINGINLLWKVSHRNLQVNEPLIASDVKHILANEKIRTYKL